MNKIILASASPRRMEILKQAGIEFDIKVSNVSEDILSFDPENIVKILSERKARAVYEAVNGNSIIIAADTVVACNGRIMGKPKDKEDAVQMIKELQGKVHSVFTGVTIIINDRLCCEMDNFAVETKVKVNVMTENQIRRYVETEEPMDKAGAYAIQGKFAININGIEGDYYNVAGLPLSEIYQRLLNKGYDIITK